VWLVADSALERAARAGSLSLGTALRLLETAGVDAVLVTPGWLALGPDTLAALAGRTRIFLLSASLTDTLGEPVCHPLMVKRLGASMLGFTGLWTDSAGPLPQGVRARLAAPSRIAGTMVHLLRQRADCVGALVGPTEAMTSGGYDLVVAGATASGTSSSLVRHDVTVRAGLVERITRVEPSIGGLLPDTLVRRALGGQGDEH
jgi:hypothetical protein